MPKTVSPVPITGRERPDELFQNAFPAFVGRQIRTAWQLMARSIEQDATVFATLSGTMTPAGIHQSCIVPMIVKGLIDVLTTTGADLYHDAHRVHRLEEEPTRRATIADITCDSDGKIDRFIEQEDVATVLPLHPLRDNEPYYLAVLLIGAYQETLGDLHNLFGDTNLLHIRFDEDEGWYVDEVVEGDTVGEVLGYLQYDVRELFQAIRRDCERSVRAKQLTAAESRVLLSAYEAGLTGYTYLE